MSFKGGEKESTFNIFKYVAEKKIFFSSYNLQQCSNCSV